MHGNVLQRNKLSIEYQSYPKSTKIEPVYQKKKERKGHINYYGSAIATTNCNWVQILVSPRKMFPHIFDNEVAYVEASLMRVWSNLLQAKQPAAGKATCCRQSNLLQAKQPAAGKTTCCRQSNLLQAKQPAAGKATCCRQSNLLQALSSELECFSRLVNCYGEILNKRFILMLKY